MRETNIVIVEDDPSAVELIEDFCMTAMKELNSLYNVHVYKNKEEYEERPSELHISLLIIDIDLLGTGLDLSGWEIISDTIEEEFIPIIVYSAHVGDPGEHRHKNTLIEIVVKASGVNLAPIIQKFIQIKKQYSLFKESLISEFEKISHSSISAILGSEYNFSNVDEKTILHLAYSRISSYLLNVPPLGSEEFPPESIFIFPCLEIPGYAPNTLFLGTILKQKINGDNLLWLVVSPSCDLIINPGRMPKINSVLLLRCYTEYTDSFIMKEKTLEQRKNHLEEGIKNNKYKILKCPEHIFDCQTLLLSFKDYSTVNISEILNGIEDRSWEKIASIAVPYAESIQNVFLADISRIGTPFTSNQEKELEWTDIFLTSNK